MQTVGNNEPRFDYNPATGECLGLWMEEPRTNLLLNSATLSTQSVTVTAAVHTLSFYGSGTVVLSGAASQTVVGAGAFPARTTVVFTPSAGTLTLTVTGTVQYANLEAGEGATTWIPTTGATATRAQENLTLTGTALSGLYRTDEGTLIVFADFFTSTGVPAGVSFNDASANNFIRPASLPTKTVRATMTTAAAPQVGLTLTGTLAPGDSYCAAMSFRENDVKVCANGGSLLTDTSALIPGVTRLSCGVVGASQRLRSIMYFARALTATEILALTSAA